MTLSAVLFTGGESRRMGADKATLLWEGEPLWERQLRTLRELKPDALLVSARSRPAWCPGEIDFVADQIPSRGPLSGLAATLASLRTTHLLALAIDLPRMTADELGLIWHAARRDCGVVPVRGDHLEPLCAVYPARAADVATALLTAENVSLHHFTRKLEQRGWVEFRNLTADELELYHNVNSPSDLPREAGQRI